MLSEEQLNDIRDAWRGLGFHYDRDDAAKQWNFIGSGTGLFRFVSVLREYVADARNRKIGEHEHYGPYMYLKIVTRDKAGMDGGSIHGSLEDLARLADLVENAANRLKPGEAATIREEYAADAEYSMILELREDGFDPSSKDR